MTNAEKFKCVFGLYATELWAMDEGEMLKWLNAECKEPERKKGRWIDGQCSICGCDVPAYIIDWKWQKDMDANFCPNCGADMKGE